MSLKPSKLILKDDNYCELVLTEGKTHQVRRMVAKFGRSVITLKRIKIGNIQVNEEEGILEKLTEDELNGLKKLLSI